MKKVTGIGGIFFKCKDPQNMKAWYSRHLGIDAGEYGFNFNWNEGLDQTNAGSTTWAPFDQSSNYFLPSPKDFMINYRVENLEELVKQLKSDGIPLLDEMEIYPYGKFIHLLDPEENKIELWEPTESANP
jgi:predicted enzyme related to lactoylglutathione lyase